MTRKAYKKLAAFLLIATIVATIFAPIASAGSGDYGIYVKKIKFYNQNGKFYMKFEHITEYWDTYFYAKMLDSNGKTVATWDGFTVYGETSHNNSYWLTPSMYKKGKYTFLVRACVVDDGEELWWSWKYPINIY